MYNTIIEKFVMISANCKPLHVALIVSHLTFLGMNKSYALIQVLA